MARLFFAVRIPEEIELDLLEVERGLPDARWTFGRGLHLTLAFLGECSRAQARVARSLASELSWSSFEIRLDGAGVFPLRGHPKVLWMGVSKSPALEEQQRSLTRDLRAADFELERRKYHPHVTLARIGATPPGRVQEWLEEFISYRSEPFVVRSFQLYESTLTQKGPHYTIVDEFDALG